MYGIIVFINLLPYNNSRLGIEENRLIVIMRWCLYIILSDSLLIYFVVHVTYTLVNLF